MSGWRQGRQHWQTTCYNSSAERKLLSVLNSYLLALSTSLLRYIYVTHLFKNDILGKTNKETSVGATVL